MFYDKDGQMISHSEWEALSSDSEYRRVGMTAVQDTDVAGQIWVIHTTWVGTHISDEIDVGHQKPRIFQTVTQCERLGTGPRHYHRWTYPTLLDAITGHRISVNTLLNEMTTPSLACFQESDGRKYFT